MFVICKFVVFVFCFVCYRGLVVVVFVFLLSFVMFFFFFKQKTAYEMRISDWSSDVCSSDLTGGMSASLHVDQLALSIAGRLVRKNGGDRQAETTRHGFGRHRLRVVTDYVEDALEMGLSLKDLSNLAAMSVTHFTRQFRAEMGMSPHQYVVR